MYEKGDVIIYRFGTHIQEAKITKIYANEYVKVRHTGFSDCWYSEIIHTDRIIGHRK